MQRLQLRLMTGQSNNESVAACEASTTSALTASDPSTGLPAVTRIARFSLYANPSHVLSSFVATKGRHTFCQVFSTSREMRYKYLAVVAKFQLLGVWGNATELPSAGGEVSAASATRPPRSVWWVITLCAWPRSSSYCL